MNDFYANQYNDQATEKDDHASQVTCTILRREQMVKGMTCRTNLCKELIICGI